MKEVQPTSGLTSAQEEQETTGGPDETQLAIIAILMRLYDVNLALLNHFDSARADAIYESHERGDTFNPPIFIPNMVPNDAQQSQ